MTCNKLTTNILTVVLICIDTECKSSHLFLSLYVNHVNNLDVLFANISAAFIFIKAIIGVHTPS